jgi:hypothetical protein
MSPKKETSPAEIEYAGIPGVTEECKDAVQRLLQYGDQIVRARILTSPRTDRLRDHCLLLTVNVGNLIAIKSGFASGYLGEGSHGFSFILQLLRRHCAEIREYEVAEDVIERLDMSSLTSADIEQIDAARTVRPVRWHDYIFEQDWEREESGRLWQNFPPVIPWAIIDGRITDLALKFFEHPDESLLTGYRRLEDIVRKRTGIDEHGVKLFSEAFQGETAKLGWEGLGKSERAGRANLFTGAYMAYRNPRAHRELKPHINGQLAEFLLLNHLFVLEKESIEQIGSNSPSRDSKAKP